MIEAHHRALRAAENKHESREQIAALTSDYRFEDDIIEDEINMMISRYWISKAQHLFLPTPSKEDPTMWSEASNMPDRKVLTHEGITKIRSQVRAERKEQMEMCLPWLTALTGLIGVLIGLVAILRK